MLEFFSASTSIVNSKRAITECLEVALEGQPNLDCDLIIMYSGIGHNFKDLLSEAKTLSPGARIVGCTGSGVIGREGPDESMKALAIMAIKGPEDEFAIAGMDDIGKYDPFEVGSRLATDLKNKISGINTILYNPSILGLYPKYDPFSGIESVFGPDIPIVGALSFDNAKGVSDFQFFGDRVFEKGAVAVGFADPTLELISQANHSFTPIGESMTITKSDYNRVYELDGKPAWKAWMDKLGMPETTTPIEVSPFGALAIELPEELHEEYGSGYFLLSTLIVEKDGSICVPTLFPEGTKLWLTRRFEDHIQQGVDRMMTQILERCDGRKPVAVFHADCAARGKLLFNRIYKEELIGRLQHPLCKGEKIPWLGLYGSGELTPMGGKNFFHVYTSSLYIFVRRKPVSEKKEVKHKTKELESSRLFEATRIKNISLKNRFIGSATWMGKANPDGSCSPILINSLARIARGDIGMVVTGMAGVSRNAQSAPLQLGAFSDDFFPGLSLMVERVHRAGAPVVLQLEHGGLLAPHILTGEDPSGPSVLQTPDGPIGKEMQKEEIKETIEAFKHAAIRAQKAGFDGVQIHAAHGFLISQFLSPYFNKRTDEYGGNVENRARMLLEVIEGTREAIGDKLAILVKINSEDLLDGGFSIDDMLRVSAMLEKAGVDAIELSGGTIGASLLGDMENSPFPVNKKGVYCRDAAKRFKEKIRIPLILVGGIRSFKIAEELVKTGITDYISMARPLIREPNLIKRWKSGDFRDSKCISDSLCLQQGMEGKEVHCVHIKDE